jgi:hypothetical protein
MQSWLFYLYLPSFILIKVEKKGKKGGIHGGVCGGNVGKKCGRKCGETICFFV